MAYASRAVQKAIGTDPHLRLLFRDSLIDSDIHKDPVRYGELLAICQHYGMKTPLIDVTDSAFVALYFAAWFAMQKTRKWRSENHLAVWKIPTNLWNDGLSYVMIPDKEPATLAKMQHAFEQDPGKRLTDGSMKVSISNVFPRVYRNDRLVAQQGSFVQVRPDLPLDHVLAMMHVRKDTAVFEPMLDWLTQYTLPASLALDCLVHLTKMNIRPDTLFPDLPGQMDRIDLAADHYDYSGMGGRLRGSLFDSMGLRRPNFNA